MATGHQGIVPELAASARARTTPCMRALSTHRQHGPHNLLMPCVCATEVEEGAGRQVFDLSLTELGPYRVDVTRSGRLVVLGGRKGHLAMLDWHQLRTVCELQVCLQHAHSRFSEPPYRVLFDKSLQMCGTDAQLLV